MWHDPQKLADISQHRPAQCDHAAVCLVEPSCQGILASIARHVREPVGECAGRESRRDNHDVIGNPFEDCRNVAPWRINFTKCATEPRLEAG